MTRKEVLDFSKISPLSESDVESAGYELKDLWMVHYREKIFGPYHTNLMRQLAKRFPKELESSSACQLERGRWLFFFDHRAFQGRDKQTLYRPVSITNEPILIYAAEKEHGPFSLNQLLKKLKEKEFKYVDLFSLDKGETWRKIYEIEGLDRRNEGSEDLKLPTIPETSAYSQEQLAFIQKTPENHNIVLELKKIASEGKRANSPHLEKKKYPQRSHPSRIRRLKKETATRSQKEKSWLPFFIILALLALAIWVMLKKQSSSTQKISSTTKKRTYQRKVTKFTVPKPKKREEAPDDSSHSQQMRQKEFTANFHSTDLEREAQPFPREVPLPTDSTPSPRDENAPTLAKDWRDDSLPGEPEPLPADPREMPFPMNMELPMGEGPHPEDEYNDIDGIPPESIPPEIGEELIEAVEHEGDY